MELNSKKLERTSKLIYYSISIILCIFLILLSNKIIDDLDSVTTEPQAVQFDNKTTLPTLEEQIKQLDYEIETAEGKGATIKNTIAVARKNYQNEKQSFDNWLQTRKTLGSPDKDQEVLSRAKKLDEFYKIEEAWNAKLNKFETQTASLTKKKNELKKLVDKEKSIAKTNFEKALKWYELKVFLIRLLFVGPILAIGIFFFIKKRKDKYWPLYFGVTLFSVYAFFFGLLPYLPSYGGYVRYIVGIGLSGGIGYYAIKKIRIYLEEKQAELKISTQERSKNVQTQTAEKALENHFCPSCGKDFIMKKWEFPLKIISENELNKMVSTFCRHCGLELFKKCNSCGHDNFAHLPYCSNCGINQTPNK